MTEKKAPKFSLKQILGELPKNSIVTEHKSPQMPDDNMSVQQVPENILGETSGGSVDNSCVETVKEVEK